MPRRRKRLDPAVFNIPQAQLRAGFYADVSLAAARESWGEGSTRAPRVTWQVSSAQVGYVSGVDEAVAILKLGTEEWNALNVHALTEGERVERGDLVLSIDGPLDAFVHLTSPILAVLSRRSRVATNARRVVEAADSKPVILLAERDDHFVLQAADAYAANVGGIVLFTSDAQTTFATGKHVAWVPYELIAAAGDVGQAAKLVAANTPANRALVVPVDYENDCVRTSVEAARALEGRLWGVALATPNTMVDKSVLSQMGTFEPAGVNPQLVWNVRNGLDAEDFGEVKIVVAGGFDANRIRAWEDEGGAVDVYAVGAELHEGTFELWADVVKVEGKKQARAGREDRSTSKLQKV